MTGMMSSFRFFVLKMCDVCLIPGMKNPAGRRVFVVLEAGETQLRKHDYI
jgi:hypothetical protein